MYKNFIKRILDFCLALCGLIIAFPILVVVTLLLMIVNRGTSFFYQKRPGLNEKLFNIIKFKTMTDAKDSKGALLPDAERMTKIGSFVRKTSLDELPQLLNVLKGDMSLIGPRPLLPEYLPLYSKEQKKRHNVRPGITGWAQVNGRNAISWQKKFKYDVWYVANQNFVLDVKIIFLTIKKVLKRDGVNLSEQVSSEYFNGNN